VFSGRNVLACRLVVFYGFDFKRVPLFFCHDGFVFRDLSCFLPCDWAL
jgi:hypothetical protein